jgi:hypothetical protein
METRVLIRHIILRTFVHAIFYLVVFSSCKKERSCEDCKGNKPPVAKAGLDQWINLPLDSITVNGSQSYDPDGSIVRFSWRRIGGPASHMISSPASHTTAINSLVPGSYSFELRVTDNGGLSALDTIRVVVSDPSQPNRPPVANAGPDQVIILPVVATTLNGSASTDPDNNIVIYSWSRISGPSSANIAQPNSVQSVVDGLQQGTYLFELHVIDDGGLSDRDTVQIEVSPLPPPPACDGTSRATIQAQLVPIGTLSKARMLISPITVGTKILFAGGRWSEDCPDCWGSSRVDIYDTVTHQWSIAELSAGRFGLATTSFNNKAFFAGGENGDGAFNLLYDNVDIYDAVSNTWSTATLSEKRSYIAAATVGSKVFFAGGWQEEHRFVPPTSKVDIYDFQTNTWSVANLSLARGYIAPIVHGQKIFFGGGWRYGELPSDRIDIYDDASQSWSTSNLLIPMMIPGGIRVGDQLTWADGCDVEIKNALSGSSIAAKLFNPGEWYIADGQNLVRKDNKVIFFRAHGITNKFDIYDLSSNTWSVGVLSNFDVELTTIISVNNTIYVTGGWDKINGKMNDTVWKLVF